MNTEEWNYRCNLCRKYGVNVYDPMAGIIIQIKMIINALEGIDAKIVNNQMFVN